MTARHAQLALAFALALLGAGCGDDAAARAQEAALQGSVRDAVTGDSLGGVKLTFTSDTLDESATRTGSGGRFTLFVTTRSPHGRLRAEKSGYVAQVVSVFLDENRVEVDLELNPS